MPADLQSILRIQVPVIVQIASRDMPVEDVLKLSPGAIIELPKLADEELEILVANKQIGLGTAVKVGENFGIRVSYVGDVRERIAALGRENVSEEASGAEEEEADEDEPAAAIAEQLLAAQQKSAESQ
ncbi:MAG: FliM/FliN family flagellar motor switch protein [Planctomycetota bacterium]|nr:FliM/FliN family flagellar motor switch protein [Planctomycetota bacterium]